MSEAKEFLRTLDMFNGLSDEELSYVAALCSEASYQVGDIILNLNDPTENFYLIRSGTVQVITNPDILETKPELASAVMINLGEGQSFGEMGLVDQGAR